MSILTRIRLWYYQWIIAQHTSIMLYMMKQEGAQWYVDLMDQSIRKIKQALRD